MILQRRNNGDACERNVRSQLSQRGKGIQHLSCHTAIKKQNNLGGLNLSAMNLLTEGLRRETFRRRRRLLSKLAIGMIAIIIREPRVTTRDNQP